MYKVSKYPHGAFSWADNNSTDPEAAKPFYQALLGWDKDEIPMDPVMPGATYTMFKLRRRIHSRAGSNDAGYAASRCPLALEQFRNGGRC